MISIILALVTFTEAVTVERFFQDTGYFEVDEEMGWREGKCPYWKDVNKVENVNLRPDNQYDHFTTDF